MRHGRPGREALPAGAGGTAGRGAGGIAGGCERSAAGELAQFIVMLPPMASTPATETSSSSSGRAPLAEIAPASWPFR